MMHTIRAVTQTDYAALATLYQSERTPTNFAQLWQMMWQWMQNGRSAWLLVLHQDTLIGSGQLLLHPQKAELANLHIAPTYRNQGHGTQLIHALETIAQEKQVHLLELRVLASNQAKQLYTRLGYTPKRHLPLPEGDVWVMQKQLTNN